jgi:hypothetical protein
MGDDRSPVPWAGAQPAGDGAPWPDQPAPFPGPGRPARPRTGPAVTAAVAGVIGLVASLAGLNIRIMPRHFTASERHQIISWEAGKRWRTWPAGRIFPAAVTYQLSAANLASDKSLTLTARRVGIAPQAPCAAVTDRAAGRLLAGHGCSAVLRASYADATGAFVTTVGVAVLPSSHAAAAAAAALAAPGNFSPGVRAASFPHTLTAWFGDQDRQLSLSMAAGPYVVMYAAGYADGRPRAGGQGDRYGQGEMLSAAAGIAGFVAAKMGAQPPAPACPGTPGC